ncbi:hypothetical protein ACFS07_26070 [Undibacterium arcticum]
MQRNFIAGLRISLALIFQMAKHLGLLAAEQDVNVLLELRQGDIDPPALIACVGHHTGPVRIALVEYAGPKRGINTLDGFIFLVMIFS